LTNRRIPPNDGPAQVLPAEVDVRARGYAHLAVEVDLVPLAQLVGQQLEHGALVARHTTEVSAALVGGAVEGKLRTVLGHGRGPTFLAGLRQARGAAERLDVALIALVMKARRAEHLDPRALLGGEPLWAMLLPSNALRVAPASILRATHWSDPIRIVRV